MAEILIAIMLTILVGALVAAVSFWAGIRYCAGNMLARLMAGMTEEELDRLADEVEGERRALGLPTEEPSPAEE